MVIGPVRSIAPALRRILLCFFLLLCSARRFGFVSGISTKEPQFWAYSLVATDYDGHKMLPFFLDHYRKLGVTDKHFHFDLLHDPSEPDDGLKSATGVLAKLGMSFQVIGKPYTPALQDIQMMLSLDRLDIPAQDWIIVADTDEMYTYGYDTLAETAAAMEAENATFALGEMLDHLAIDGQLATISTEESVWDQFPLICPITAGVGKGLPAKVTLHRGFLRAGAGHHHIVDPELAQAYFSKHCWGEKCEIVMKTYKQRSTVDLYRRTPYFRLRTGFKSSRRQLSDVLMHSSTAEWSAKQWSKWSKVHHFKWHNGLKQNLYQRTLRDNGDCILNVNEETCTPKFQFWQEVARQYNAVSTGSFNISGLGCKEGIETFWNWKK